MTFRLESVDLDSIGGKRVNNKTKTNVPLFILSGTMRILLGIQCYWFTRRTAFQENRKTCKLLIINR